MSDLILSAQIRQQSKLQLHTIPAYVGPSRDLASVVTIMSEVRLLEDYDA